MPVTMQEVRALLDPEEPDYEQARQVGPDALPHLTQIVLGGDELLAAKATYLAGFIAAERSADVLQQAARSPNAALRVAAAGAARYLPAAKASEVLMSLVIDDDLGVRKVAFKSVAPGGTPELRMLLERQSRQEGPERMRKLAAEALERLRRRPKRR